MIFFFSNQGEYFKDTKPTKMPQNNINFKSKYEKAEARRKYAWSQYYSLQEQEFNSNTNVVNELEQSVQNDEEMVMTDHLKRFIQKLYKESKEKITCPICLDPITDFQELDTQRCGHNFHKECFKASCSHQSHKKFVECGVCRTKLYNKEFQQ